MFKLGGNTKTRKPHKRSSKGKHRHAHKRSGDARRKSRKGKSTKGKSRKGKLTRGKSRKRKSRKSAPKRKSPKGKSTKRKSKARSTKRKSNAIRTSKARFTKKRSRTPKGNQKGFSSRARKTTQFAHHHPIKTKKQCSNTSETICGIMGTKGEQCKLTKPKKKKDGTVVPERCVKKSKRELSRMKHRHGPNWGRKELKLNKKKQ